MVTPGGAVRWGRGLLAAVRRDLAGMKEAVRPARHPRPGLRTYRVYPPGGSRILHLRIEPDGGGTLLVDVADAIHLNATAALLVGMALDGRGAASAAAALRRRRGADRRRIEHDVRTVYRLVDHLRSTTDPCPTCGLDAIGRKDLFTAPVSAPYKADLALTYGCNNSCGHCYNDKDRIGSRPLTPNQWIEVLDRLHGIGVPHVIFTGGEPTLHPALPELVAHAGRLGLVSGMNSNGRRMADRLFARAVARAGLSHLQVTLQSHRPEIHNAMSGATAFEETVQGIQSALGAGLHTITNTTLTEQNAGEAEQTVEFLHRLGLTTFAMNGMIHSGSGCGFSGAIPEEVLAPVLAAVRDRAHELGMRFLWYTPTPYCRLSPVELGLGPRRCNAAQTTVAIEPDGAVLPCQSDYRPAGNILRDDWSAIWESRLFRGFRERVADPQGFGLPEDCWQCPDLPVCGGGCRLTRAALQGLDIANRSR